MIINIFLHVLVFVCFTLTTFIVVKIGLNNLTVPLYKVNICLPEYMLFPNLVLRTGFWF